MRYGLAALLVLTAWLTGLRPANVMADDLALLSDEFNDAATLKQWQRVCETEGWGADQLETLDINGRQKGCLLMIPFTSTWYRDYRGELTYKLLDGDFVATTHLRVTGRDGKNAPASPFSLAGLMVRAPRDITPQTWRPGQENYVFLSLGAADRPGNWQWEIKTTRNSDSQLHTSTASGPEAQIQIARVGPSFILLRKDEGGTWTIHGRFYRPDLPRQLQVGLTCYTDWPSAHTLDPAHHNATVIRNGRPDLMVLYDYYRLHRPVVPAELQERILADPRRVTDAQLLAFLGESAAAP